MDEKRLELKVGLLVALALCASAALLWVMGEISFTEGVPLDVDFGHTGNVVKGAPVKLGGIVVGRVEKVSLAVERRDASGLPLPVRMTLAISKEARGALRADAAVTVATQGPLGEAYLELYPGETAPMLSETADIRGVDAPRLDLVANRLSSFLESASRVLEQDPEVLGKLATSLEGAARGFDGVLTENRGDLRTLVVELSAAAQDLRALSRTARRTLEPGGTGASLLEDAHASARLLRHELPQLTDHAAKTLGGLSALSGGFTPQDGIQLRQALLRYAAAGERLEKLAERGERVLSEIEAGQGSLGGFYKDPQVYEDLKGLVTDLKKHPWKVLWKE